MLSLSCQCLLGQYIPKISGEGEHCDPQSKKLENSPCPLADLLLLFSRSLTRNGKPVPAGSTCCLSPTAVLALGASSQAEMKLSISAAPSCPSQCLLRPFLPTELHMCGSRETVSSPERSAPQTTRAFASYPLRTSAFTFADRNLPPLLALMVYWHAKTPGHLLGRLHAHIKGGTHEGKGPWIPTIESRPRKHTFKKSPEDHTMARQRSTPANN